MVNDPIADFLTRIRNAGMARKQSTRIPWSRLKESLAQILVDEGFLGASAVVGEGYRREIEVALRYDEKKKPIIERLERVSRPGLRIYKGKTEIPLVQSGLGIAVISTSHGLMVDREARKRGVGGEVLCRVW